MVEGDKGAIDRGGRDLNVGDVGVDDGGAPNVAEGAPGAVVPEEPGELDAVATATPFDESTVIIGFVVSAPTSEIGDSTALSSELAESPPRVVLQTIIAIPRTNTTTDTGPNHFLAMGESY